MITFWLYKIPKVQGQGVILNAARTRFPVRPTSSQSTASISPIYNSGVRAPETEHIISETEIEALLKKYSSLHPGLDEPWSHTSFFPFAKLRADVYQKMFGFELPSNLNQKYWLGMTSLMLSAINIQDKIKS